MKHCNLSLSLSASLIAVALSGKSLHAKEYSHIPTIQLSQHIAQKTPNSIAGKLSSGSQFLGDDSNHNIHIFEGIEDEKIVIDLTSDDFDTYPILLNPEDNKIAEDDDSGNNSDDRLSATFPLTKASQIIANPYSAGQSSRYSFSRRPGAPEVSSSIGTGTAAATADPYQLELAANDQFERGDYKEAIELYERALAIYRRENNRAREATVLMQLGGIYQFLDQPAQIIEYATAALTIAEEINASGDLLYLRVFPRYALGAAYRALGQVDREIEAYEQAFEVVSTNQLTSLHPLIDSAQALASAYANAEQYDRAIDLYERSLATARENSFNGAYGQMADQIESALFEIGLVYENQQNYRQAINFYQQALDFHQEVSPFRYDNGFSLGEERNYHNSVANYLISLGRIYLETGEYQRAEALLQEASYIRNLTRSAGLNDLVNVAELESLQGALLLLQRALIEQGRYKEALEIAEQSRGQAFSELIVQNIGFSADAGEEDVEELEQLKALAREKQTTVVLYALSKASPEPVDIDGLRFQVNVWLISPEGDVDFLPIAMSDAQITDLATISRQAFYVIDNQSGKFPQFSYRELFLSGVRVAETATYGFGLEDRIINELRDQFTHSLNTTRAVYSVLTESDNEDLIYVPALSITDAPTKEALQTFAKQQQSTLVEYSIDDYGDMLSIWIISPDGTIDFRQQSLSGVALESLVGQTRNAIGVRGERATIGIAGGGNNQNRAMADQQLRQLYDVLIAPIADLLPRDPEQPVVFIPDNELFLAPFPALRSENGTYLIEDHTILTAPSIQVLELTSELSASSSSSSSAIASSDNNFVIVGNPSMPTVTFFQESSGFEDIRLDSLPVLNGKLRPLLTYFKPLLLLATMLLKLGSNSSLSGLILFI